MEVIVDIQCFNYDDQMIIKEQAAIDFEGTIIPRAYVFRPLCACMSIMCTMYNELTKKASIANG